MIYMTKEWYNTMQKTSFHLMLKTTKKAESFSEDYFKKLYMKEEGIWLQLQEDVSNVNIEDIFSEEFYMESLDGNPIDTDEFEEAKEMYFKMREQIISEHKNNPPVFDIEQQKKIFKKSFQCNLKLLKENLPTDILDEVADIRVLALNRASADIRRKITIFCKKNDKSCRNAMDTYWKNYKRTFRRYEPAFAEQFNFHDCRIISSRQEGNDFIIKLDNSGGFTSIKKIIFKDCIILKQDSILKNVWWLYDEIYKTDNGYEIHALLQGKEVIDFIVDVKDVIFK